MSSCVCAVAQAMCQTVALRLVLTSWMLGLRRWVPGALMLRLVVRRLVALWLLVL